MKVPLNWLKKIVQIPTNVRDLSDNLTMVGHMLDKIEVKDGETILDLELRGNRADCYSILGIAREVSAIYGSKLKSLALLPVKAVKKLDHVSLDVRTPLVKRVGIVEIKNVKVAGSPKWLKDSLTAYGMESINNIVDLTNYVMIETGEPMHAFDLDKVVGNLEIRLAKNNEKLTTFMNTQITLTKDDLVWAKGNQILSVAGAVGEKFNSISDSTTNILLEAANYDRANIRRTVYRHRLLTDAGIRHEKELDPNMVDFAISRFLYLMKKEGWGEFEANMFDYYPNRSDPWKVNLDLSYLNRLSSLVLTLKEVKNILKKLNFKILSSSNTNVVMQIPTYRTDVVLEEDVIEEIVRIYGYDKVPTKILSLEIPKNVTPNYIIQEDSMRMAASAVGFDENISLSFVREEHKEDGLVTIINSPSPDIKYLRKGLFFNLLDSTNKIVNDRGEKVMLFEIGKVYFGKKDSYKELRKIGFIYWSKTNNDFSDFKSLISAFFAKTNIKSPDYVLDMFDLKFVNSYQLKLNNKQVGFGGMCEDIFYCEIDLDSILNTESKYEVKLWPKFPPQIEDMTLTVPSKTYVGNILNYIHQFDKLITSVSLKDVFENSYTFNIEYQHPSQTLNDKDVADVRKRLITNLKTKFGITLKE